MRFFLAGIMQGSLHTDSLHDQSYRERLAELLRRHFPDADVYDPLAHHSDALDYSDQRAREVFLGHNRMCREVDVVLAFVPEASMGTAIEMWEAHRHGRAVFAVSPMRHNWAVKFCSHEIFPDLGALEDSLVSGHLARRIDEILNTRDS